MSGVPSAATCIWCNIVSLGVVVLPLWPITYLTMNNHQNAALGIAVVWFFCLCGLNCRAECGEKKKPNE